MCKVFSMICVCFKSSLYKTVQLFCKAAATIKLSQNENWYLMEISKAEKYVALSRVTTSAKFIKYTALLKVASLKSFYIFKSYINGF